jgi:hypothetical protein
MQVLRTYHDGDGPLGEDVEAQPEPCGEAEQAVRQQLQAAVRRIIQAV